MQQQAADNGKTATATQPAAACGATATMHAKILGRKCTGRFTSVYQRQEPEPMPKARTSEAEEAQVQASAASNSAIALIPLAFIILFAVVVSDDEPSEVFDQNEACGWWQDQFYNEDRWQWEWQEDYPEQQEQPSAGEASPHWRWERDSWWARDEEPKATSWEVNMMVQTGIHQANCTEERIGEAKPELAVIRLALANQADFLDADEPPA